MKAGEVGGGRAGGRVGVVATNKVLIHIHNVLKALCIHDLLVEGHLELTAIL